MLLLLPNPNTSQLPSARTRSIASSTTSRARPSGADGSRTNTWRNKAEHERLGAGGGLGGREEGEDEEKGVRTGQQQRRRWGVSETRLTALGLDNPPRKSLCLRNRRRLFDVPGGVRTVVLALARARASSLAGQGREQTARSRGPRSL